MKDYSGDAGQKLLSMKEASAFVNDVKVVFQDKMEKYDEFVKVLYDFKAMRIDQESATAKMEELFDGHSDLIMKLNSLMLKRSLMTNNDHNDTEAKQHIKRDRFKLEVIDQFNQMLDKLEKFELKVIAKLDQIGSSAQHSTKAILDIAENMKKRGVTNVSQK
jgi:methyl-accepting chemotaxis protein